MSQEVAEALVNVEIQLKDLARSRAETDGRIRDLEAQRVTHVKTLMKTVGENVHRRVYVVGDRAVVVEHEKNAFVVVVQS